MTQGRPIRRYISGVVGGYVPAAVQPSVSVGRFVSPQALAAVGCTGSLSFSMISIATGAADNRLLEKGLTWSAVHIVK